MSSLANLRDQADSGDEPKVPRSSKSSTPAPNYFCLDNKHSPVLLTEDRLFYFDGPGCPVCPVCQKQVIAQDPSYNAKGQPQIPYGLIGLAARINEPVPY